MGFTALNININSYVSNNDYFNGDISTRRFYQKWWTQIQIEAFTHNKPRRLSFGWLTHSYQLQK